jgi:hypothetical protein
MGHIRPSENTNSNPQINSTTEEHTSGLKAEFGNMILPMTVNAHRPIPPVRLENVGEKSRNLNIERNGRERCFEA